MANPWFRLYSEFLNDPKVRKMEEKHQLRLVLIFCLRCSSESNALRDDDITFALRISADEWQVTKAIFIEHNFMDLTGKVLNWDNRQLRSDHDLTGAERQKRWRDTHRNALRNAVTNGDVTPPEQIQNRTDTDNKAKPPQKKKPSSTTLPENFGISERVKLWADGKGFIRLPDHLENFVSAARKKGYTYTDWDEAFMDAIRKDWAKLGSPATKQPFSMDEFMKGHA